MNAFFDRMPAFIVRELNSEMAHLLPPLFSPLGQLKRTQDTQIEKTRESAEDRKRKEVETLTNNSKNEEQMKETQQQSFTERDHRKPDVILTKQ
jgi:hypothetical protein